MALFCLLIFPVFVGCNNDIAPISIELGRDACASCKMTIVDGRYGGEIVTDKGKIYKFDAVDCLIRFLRKNSGQAGKTYVSDFTRPGSLIESSQVVFGILETRTSPMGSRYVGFASAAEAQATLGTAAQPLMSWAELFDNLSK